MRTININKVIKELEVVKRIHVFETDEETIYRLAIDRAIQIIKDNIKEVDNTNSVEILTEGKKRFLKYLFSESNDCNNKIKKDAKRIAKETFVHAGKI